MPTLEERIAALERAQSIMLPEQMDTRQIEAQIRTLEQQAAEQERSTDTLTRAITQQFNTINTSINARFDVQTAAIREQFGDTNMAITSLTVTVNSQGQDIKGMKADIRGIANHLDGMDQQFERVETRLDSMDRRFDAQDEKLVQILERLPKQGES